MNPRHTLELLAPAKTADFGIEAINHGADAVYIGGPAFGARSAADNTVEDIARLVAHAHRYHAEVFVATNTILFDDELEPARRLIRQLYDAGVDALIVQDMGLLELDLPPIQLHASTQTDIRDASKARFLQDVGFSQIVLARELSLAEVRKIAAATSCQLEYFVHGALCVAFSGQCYISHAHTGRSANRGECSQACRLPYDLKDKDGNTIASQQHMLSMKDNNQSANLRALAAAGVSSFKIEGRYKDLSYVKNITAHYRMLLDEIIEHPDADGPAYRRASSGRTTFLFTPQADKTFNRGYTDYFANERRHGIEAFESPKFVGEPIGRVTKIDTKGRRFFDIERSAPIHNADGLTWYGPKGELTGLRVNRSEPDGGGEGIDRVFPSEALPPELVPGTSVFRNHDHVFERALEKKSSERRIRIDAHLALANGGGFALTLTDEDGISACATLAAAFEPAQHAERAQAALREHIGKLGNTLFTLDHLVLDLPAPPFLPSGQLNTLRRNAVERLEAARIAAHARPPRAAPVEPPAPYPQDALSYLANVLNDRARAFYARHGVQLIDAAFEENQRTDEVSLMITKHCLRYSFNLCPKEVKGIRPEPMQLVNGNETLTLRFDCKRCEMHVVGAMKPHIARMRDTVAVQTLNFFPNRPAAARPAHETAHATP
ncbi:peptidase U32 family protein [Thauera linaloolentis]|uniref:Peptidase U32 n=1 Tax=Thauera linaloolentis (strain DSM 12138 / JCM 21573 / CCUG 41526 / CIP 105981 / IAM 15112 / NBRC 102519 / 47Lol) TaxID=1123367 RepID=N6Y401_THAL4|nr:U32 family peptidase [Thauera linaloolentis]ENO88891.1 peptidase U32 [Thauera linaloolentis 47Lol = DSM 12138]MCM8564814.1 U32 family peptidase [Thauera linaloolentis]